MKLLAKVEHAFTVSGRGVVVLPAWLSGMKVKAGNSIRLRLPDGRTKDTHIVAVELAKKTTGGSRAAFVLARNVVEEDVPSNTEIWVQDVATP